MTASLVSPVTGAVLVEDGPNVLRDADGFRWPRLDGIPYLRVGRETLVGEVIARLDRGDRDGALVLLLADQDEWWTGAPADAAALGTLIRDRHRLTLREAMACLAFDRVGDYFAHRWSDPTFLAGLALVEAHWRPASAAFELACGIGHYGRELMARGVAFSGADVVFSKLWLARHWVLPPAARLLCFDAAAPWPVADGPYDLVLCNDAFYFLEPKPDILERLRALAGDGGRLALSHVHNSDADNLSSGHAISAAAMAQLFPESIVYDDAELTRALAAARAPRAGSWNELASAEAFAIEDRSAPIGTARALKKGFAVPVEGAALRLNPLYRPQGDGHAIVWPSSRYEAEYAAAATYPRCIGRADSLGEDAARRRIVVDLPERW